MTHYSNKLPRNFEEGSVCV